ncbi:MAG: DinB family protein [Planctomycetota bacterium]|nr:DinB family protein [Planctomycetota bacterium]
MEYQQRLTARLLATRGFTDRLLEDFTQPGDWVYQMNENGNHALWFVGHMGVTDNFMISLIDAEKTSIPSGYAELFGIGSQPTGDLQSYPGVDMIRGFMQQRRETLLAILTDLGDDQLTHPTPEGSPEFIPDYASVFETAIWHEGLHCGQITMLRRNLGFDPVI